MEYIDEAGPGGNFMASEQTMEYFKTEFYYPDILERRSYEAWEADGSLTMEQRAAKKVRTILEEYKVETLSDDILAKMDEVVRAAEASVKK